MLFSDQYIGPIRTFFLILIFILWLGFLKALIGMLCSTSIGMLGLSVLIHIPQPLKRYYEPELFHFPVEYSGGWPIHPHTKERVRCISAMTEFCLNMIFFIAAPIAFCCMISDLNIIFPKSCRNFRTAQREETYDMDPMYGTPRVVTTPPRRTRPQVTPVYEDLNARIPPQRTPVYEDLNERIPPQRMPVYEDLNERIRGGMDMYDSLTVEEEDTLYVLSQFNRSQVYLKMA